MNQEKLKNLSTEDLEKKAKQKKQATGVLAGIVFMLYVVTIYNSVTKGEFDILLVAAIAFTVTIISNFRQVKKMEEEIKSRKLE